MKSFRHAMQGERVAISAELALHQDSGADEVAAQADLFRGRVDAMQVPDNPLAWLSMSALAASRLLLDNGIDPVPILTCRDRNRIALQSELLGLRALGINSLLLTRGRRVGKKHALHSSTVFDVTGRDLIAMAHALNEEEGLPADRRFLIGTGARIFRPGRGWAAESLAARADAGAEFLQTQLCFNLDILRRWMEALVQAKMTWHYSVVVSVAVLPAADTARWVKENMSDSKIPAAVIKRIEGADDPEQEGVAVCAEAMQQIAEIPGISGLNLISVGEPALTAAAIDASGLRS